LIGTTLITTAMTGATFAVINAGENRWTSAATSPLSQHASFGLTIGIAVCGAFGQAVDPSETVLTNGVVAALIASGAVALCGGGIASSSGDGSVRLS